MTDSNTDTDPVAETAVRWEAPGPGSWVCDRSHTSPGPTPLYRRIVSRHTEPTYRAAMKRYGGAIGSIDMQFVNGALYRRLVPLVAPDRDNGKVPPAPLLWLVTRLGDAARLFEPGVAGCCVGEVESSVWWYPAAEAVSH